MGGSQQTPHSAHGGKASSTTHPAETASKTSLPNVEPTGGAFRHATADNVPRPKWEIPQDDLEPQADDVTTSAESSNLGDRYVPGSANGGEAPLTTNFTPRRGS
jgi:hypothetical protein